MAQRDPGNEDRRHRQHEPDRKNIKVGGARVITREAEGEPQPHRPDGVFGEFFRPRARERRPGERQHGPGKPRQAEINGRRRKGGREPPLEMTGRIERRSERKQRDADRKNDEDGDRVQDDARRGGQPQDDIAETAQELRSVGRFVAPSWNSSLPPCRPLPLCSILGSPATRICRFRATPDGVFRYRGVGNS